MAHSKGGRKKGIPNKKSLLMKEILDEYQCDPVRGLLECIEAFDLIDTFEPEEKIQIVKGKANIYSELLMYIYPKRKAIDISGQLDTNANQKIYIEWQDENDSSDEAKNATAEEDLSIN